MVQLAIEHLEAVEAHFRHGAHHRLRSISVGGSMPIRQVPIGVAVHHGPFSARATTTPVGAVPIGVRVVAVELLLFRPTTTGRHAAGTLVAATAAAADGVTVVAPGASR